MSHIVKLGPPRMGNLAGPPKVVCCFCGLTKDDELLYGKMYEYDDIVTHYYCLLLSSNMAQKGNDDEGILGFLSADIKKELRRGKRLVCIYCKKNGATLGCCNSRCKRIFHFPCGLGAGSLHQYFGEFRSYCAMHRPKQIIDEYVRKEVEKAERIICYICYEEVNPRDIISTLWAPCCKKNAWFHRRCVQRLAMSAGYFFKCPLCNNKKDFQKEMLTHGIFIPSQDASWELEPNAFQELLYRHDRCDAEICLCPKGRSYTSSNAKWELSLCRTCGSQGIHMACGRLKWAKPTWDCDSCVSILRKSMKDRNPAENNDSGRDTSGRSDFEDSDTDTDISVGGTTPPPLESGSKVPIKLKPGPRSFKLEQAKKAAKQMIASCRAPRPTAASKVPTPPLPNNESVPSSSSHESPVGSLGHMGQLLSVTVPSTQTQILTKQQHQYQLHQQHQQQQQPPQQQLHQEQEQELTVPPKSPKNIREDIIMIDSDEDDVIEIIQEKPKANTIHTRNGTEIEIHSMQRTSAMTGAKMEGDLSTVLSNPSVIKSTYQHSAPPSALAPRRDMPTLGERFSSSGSFSAVSLAPTREAELKNNGCGLPDSLMSIKITNVTSLQPEEFASVPETTSPTNTSTNINEKIPNVEAFESAKNNLVDLENAKRKADVAKFHSDLKKMRVSNADTRYSLPNDTYIYPLAQNLNKSADCIRRTLSSPLREEIASKRGKDVPEVDPQVLDESLRDESFEVNDDFDLVAKVGSRYSSQNEESFTSGNCDGDAGTRPAFVSGVTSAKNAIASTSTSVTATATVSTSAVPASAPGSVSESESEIPFSVSTATGATAESDNERGTHRNENGTSDTSNSDPLDRIGLIPKYTSFRDLKFRVKGPNLFQMTVMDKHILNFPVRTISLKNPFRMDELVASTSRQQTTPDPDFIEFRRNNITNTSKNDDSKENLDPVTSPLSVDSTKSISSLSVEESAENSSQASISSEANFDSRSVALREKYFCDFHSLNNLAKEHKTCTKSNRRDKWNGSPQFSSMLNSNSIKISRRKYRKSSCPVSIDLRKIQQFLKNDSNLFRNNKCISNVKNKESSRNRGNVLRKSYSFEDIYRSKDYPVQLFSPRRFKSMEDVHFVSKKCNEDRQKCRR